MRASRLGLLAVLVVSVTAGCAVLRVGPAAEIMDLEQQTDAEKNLEAIRAMQRDLHRPREAPEFPEGPRSTSDADEESREPQVSTAPAPAAPPSALKLDKPPAVQWTPPVITRPGPPDRPVPAYTIPAPVAPGDSGAVRCVPDGMGGQRCLRP